MVYLNQFVSVVFLVFQIQSKTLNHVLDVTTSAPVVQIGNLRNVAMRDHHHIKSGKKKYAEDFDEIIAAVKAIYPTATREGSTGGWSWTIGNPFDENAEIVAESWIHAVKSGWWYRIKPPSS